MGGNLQKYFQFSPFFVDSASISDLDWEKLQNKIDQLPSALANLLTENKTAQFIEMLTQKYAVLNMRGPDIARLIRDIVIGDVFVGDMPQELARRLGIDLATAREIANQIASELFAPVLEDIKKVQMAKFPGRLPTKPVSPPPIPPRQNDEQAQKYPGEDLPESGGNIIDLRKMTNDK